MDLKDLGRELTSSITSFKSVYDQRLNALDAKVTGSTGLWSQKSLLDHLKANDQFNRLIADKRGKAVLHLEGAECNALQQKTVITSAAAGAMTSGVLPIGRLPGITAEARQELTLRNLLTATPTTFQVVDFVKVLSPMTIASPQVEAAAKAENATTFTTLSERVKTIATWIPAARQILDDFSELSNFLNSTLEYYVNMAEEQQMLSGDGTGENLHGLIPQATAFNTALLGTSWNKIDQIGRVVQQLTAAKEMQPTFVVLHPNDWWGIRLTKDGFGRYILGDPQSTTQMTTSGNVLTPIQGLFNLLVNPTTNIAPGQFLVGSGSPIAVEIRDRMELLVEVSTEHSDFFTKNLVAVRAEKRLALITRRPGSFVTGTFSSSPA